ncbi:hypothetical protein RIF29_10555 [Crotalaria pallida]|uniref:Uncharacterized protein n=1 Tax=Crotalaria pallida TaxID=3830 RepID=A0AAN9IIF4_CROPI
MIISASMIPDDNSCDDDNGDDSGIDEYGHTKSKCLKRDGMNVNTDKDDEGNTERSTKDDKTRKSTRGEPEVHETESNHAGMPNTKCWKDKGSFDGNIRNEKKFTQCEGEPHKSERSDPTIMKSSKGWKDKGSFELNQGNAQEDGCIGEGDHASTKGHQSLMVNAPTHGDEHFSEVMPMSQNFGGVHVYPSYIPVHSLQTVPKKVTNRTSTQSRKGQGKGVGCSSVGNPIISQGQQPISPLFYVPQSSYGSMSQGVFPNFHDEHLHTQHPQVPNSPVFPQVYPGVSNVTNLTSYSALLQEFMKKGGQY